MPLTPANNTGATVIYYYHSIMVLQRALLFAALVIFQAFYPGKQPLTIFSGFIFSAIAIGVGIWDGWHLFDKEPAIIFTTEGLETKGAGYQTWGDITKEEVYRFRGARSGNWYLYYKYPGGSRNMYLGDLSLPWEKINDLLLEYRKHYTQSLGSKEAGDNQLLQTIQ